MRKAEHTESGGLMLEILLGDWIELEVGGQVCRIILTESNNTRSKLQVKAPREFVKINRVSWERKSVYAETLEKKEEKR